MTSYIAKHIFLLQILNVDLGKESRCLAKTLVDMSSPSRKLIFQKKLVKNCNILSPVRLEGEHTKFTVSEWNYLTDLAEIEL